MTPRDGGFPAALPPSPTVTPPSCPQHPFMAYVLTAVYWAPDTTAHWGAAQQVEFLPSESLCSVEKDRHSSSFHRSKWKMRAGLSTLRWGLYIRCKGPGLAVGCWKRLPRGRDLNQNLEDDQELPKGSSGGKEGLTVGCSEEIDEEQGRLGAFCP